MTRKISGLVMVVVLVVVVAVTVAAESVNFGRKNIFFSSDTELHLFETTLSAEM